MLFSPDPLSVSLFGQALLRKRKLGKLFLPTLGWSDGKPGKLLIAPHMSLNCCMENPLPLSNIWLEDDLVQEHAAWQWDVLETQHVR